MRHRSQRMQEEEFTAGLPGGVSGGRPGAPTGTLAGARTVESPPGRATPSAGLIALLLVYPPGQEYHHHDGEVERQEQ